MGTDAVIAILLTLTATASYINYRFFKLPTTIGLTLVTLVFSTIYFLLNLYGFEVIPYAHSVLTTIKFDTTFLNGMLSFLLFAGAMQLNALELAKYKWIITILATIGVIISTLIVGFALYAITMLLNFKMSLIHCLLFGALIAPTDPVAVLNTLKTVAAPKSLELKIAGESLFNDGIGIAMFIIMLSVATGQHTMHANEIILLFIQQLVGALIVGMLLGYFCGWLLTQVDDLEVSILVTLALTTGGYYLASKIGISGPITIVVAGLIVGSRIKQGIMSKATIKEISDFWRMIDEILSAVLFVMIGLEVLRLTFSTDGIILALAAIPIVLIARFISVAAPVMVSQRFRRFNPFVVRIMTWGGLRGGVSIALALALPADWPIKQEIVLITYAVVVFSIVVQGLTIGSMIKRGDPSKKPIED